MLTQLLTTTAALLLLGGPVCGDSIRWAALARSEGDNTQVGGISWGTVMVSARANNGNTVTGMVCDDQVDDNTADFLCRAAGFQNGMESWGSNGNSYPNRLRPSVWYGRYNGSFALDQLRCPAGARRLDDCTSRNSIGRHDCSWQEGLVLKCRAEERGVDLDNLSVQMQKGSGVISANGTVVLNGTRSGGLVCAEGISQKTAEILCNKAGYRYLLGYNTTLHIQSSNKLHCDTISARNLTVMVEDLHCPSNSSDLGDCSGSMSNGTCDIDTALWLSCTSTESWEVANFTLGYNVAGHHDRDDLMTGNDKGTVLVTVRNIQTGEERTGFTPYIHGSSTMPAAICNMIGPHKWNVVYRRAGSISDDSNSKVSCAYIVENEMKFVLSYFWCPHRYATASECKFTMALEGYNPSNDDAYWLDC